MPVPYSPPSVGVYTRTPSHQPLVFGRPPFFFFFFFWEFMKCIWVEMDVLCGNCSVLCRMYERGKEMTEE